MYIGTLHSKYSFYELFSKGYLPFEVPELCGRATVQKASAELKYDGSKTVAALASGEIRANYCISRVDLSVTDADGKEVYSNYALGSSNGTDQYTMNVSRVLRTGSLSRNLKKGNSYAFRFVARLGNGETMEVFSDTLNYA